MNNDSSASAQQKSGTTSGPFAEITAHETSEAARLQAEIEVMNNELKKAEDDAQKRKEEAMNQYKTAAAKELEELKNKDLRTIMDTAVQKKEETVSAITQKAESNSDSCVNLVLTHLKAL